MHSQKLPPVFLATLPDDSMAPRAPAGSRVLFDSTLPAEAGDGVLVADASAAVYFRTYRVGPGGRWTAGSTNPAYHELDSERDGLRVLAVLIAVGGRWS